MLSSSSEVRLDSGGDMYPLIPPTEVELVKVYEYGGGGPEYMVDGLTTGTLTVPDDGCLWVESEFSLLIFSRSK